MCAAVGRMGGNLSPCTPCAPAPGWCSQLHPPPPLTPPLAQQATHPHLKHTQPPTSPGAGKNTKALVDQEGAGPPPPTHTPYPTPHTPLFPRLAGKNIKALVDREDEPHCFRLQKNRVFYVREELMRRATNVRRRGGVLGACQSVGVGVGGWGGASGEELMRRATNVSTQLGRDVGVCIGV